MNPHRTLLVVCAVAALAAGGCGKKSESSSSSAGGAAMRPAKPLKLVKTALPALKLTMQAPEGSKVSGGNMAFVRHAHDFGVQIQKDIFGATGDTLIIPFEKKLLKKKLVDQPDLQIWTKQMGDETAVLFAMVVQVGNQKYYVQSDGMGIFTRPQIDVMVKAVRTLAPQ